MTYTLPHFAEHLDDRLRHIPHAGHTSLSSPRGEAHGKTRHTDAQVRAAVERVHAGEPVLLVAESIGIARSALRHWVSGKRRPEATQSLQAPAAPCTLPLPCPEPDRPVAARTTRLGSI